MPQSYMDSFAPELIDALRNAHAIAVLTGAGVSAESGVPTFRDVRAEGPSQGAHSAPSGGSEPVVSASVGAHVTQTGLWAKYDPRELATPEAFARNPKLVWDWYAERRARVAAVAPNPAHYALAELERCVPDFLLATQNVDGLHRRAGSEKMVELHGNITRVKCSREGTPVARWDDGAPDEPPRCPACGAFLRPDVVWFNELLPAEAQTAAERAAGHCEVFLVAGTSAEVYPAAELPELARRAGARIVEINPNATALSARADDALRGPAGAVLPALLQAAFGA